MKKKKSPRYMADIVRNHGARKSNTKQPCKFYAKKNKKINATTLHNWIDSLMFYMFVFMRLVVILFSFIDSSIWLLWHDRASTLAIYTYIHETGSTIWTSLVKTNNIDSHSCGTWVSYWLTNWHGQNSEMLLLLLLENRYNICGIFSVLARCEGCF